MTPAEAVSFMKEHKILHMKCGDLEISLHPDALFEAVTPEMRKEAEKPDPAVDDKEIGLRGQTRAQQVALFGRWIPEDFPPKK